jgi:ABC-type multidrug transport system fused ATPase/permease subunit
VIRGIVNDVPTAVLVIAVVGLVLGLVLLGVRLVRRLVPVTREGFDAEVSSQVLGVVAALFGLLLAFVIVIEYQNLGDAQGNVAREADALAAIIRDSQAFPEPAGQQVRTAVGAYVREVVDGEWPRMRDGHDSPRAWSAVSGMYTAFQTVEPRTARATAFYGDAVRQLNEALIARRDRLASASGGLPAIIAALILVGSLVILGYATLVGSRSFWFHAIGAGAIAVVVGFSLVVVLALSFPFSGDLAISPAPYQTGILAQFSAPAR